MKEVNALALLSLKVAPNVFDISSGQYHVSIRDQIVRAQLLVRDLCCLDDVFKSVLVVGAGAGGAAVAVAAAAAGKKVRLIDAADAPFNLQRGTTKRFVGPFMYEWPESIHSNQSYPPPREFHGAKLCRLRRPGAQLILFRQQPWPLNCRGGLSRSYYVIRRGCSVGARYLLRALSVTFHCSRRQLKREELQALSGCKGADGIRTLRTSRRTQRAPRIKSLELHRLTSRQITSSLRPEWAKKM